MNILYHHRTRGEEVEGVHIRSMQGIDNFSLKIEANFKQCNQLYIGTN